MIIKSANLVLIILTSVILNNASGESEDKSSLTFVIDITESMYKVINKVNNGTKDIFATVANSDESPIDNYVLVTYGDPYVSDALITKNTDEFQRALNFTKADLKDGGDCPELAMNGIKKAIDASLPGSYLYVFTDALAKDHGIFKEVKSKAQEKRCQVVFIFLFRKCVDPKLNSTDSSENDVYHKLAEATSGQVFNLLEQDMEKFLNYVKVSIKSRRVITYTGKYPPGTHTVHYELDARATNTTIAISGEYTKAIVLGPDGDTIVDELLNSNEILILKVDEDSMPGDYNITFTSNKTAYVVVSAGSDVRFHHGFSTELPSSLDDTVFIPFSDVKNYLTIKIFGEKVQLTSVMFLDPNYHDLSLEIPLNTLDEKQKLYVTDLIDTPRPPFRIAVKCIDLDTSTTITRFGTMLLQSETFTNKKPTINIEGDDNIIIEFEGPLKLRCIVNTHPKPTIIWKDNYDMYPATVLQESQYRYISILELASVKKNSTFECSATNKMGTDTKSVQVEVKRQPYFKFLVIPSDVKVELNSEVVLHCKVDAYPPAKIEWIYPKRGFSKIQVSPDGSTLTVKHMQKLMAGNYVCKAKNENEERYSRARVTLNATKPKIDETLQNLHVREYTSVLLDCNLLEGKPKPEIRWYSKRHTTVKYIEIEEARNQTSINLKNVNRFDTGTYKCKAKNVMGLDIKFIDLFVDCPPTIKDDVKKIIVKKGEQIYMSCLVQGVPMPKVVWLKDKTPLDSKIDVFRDHSFKVEADFHHEGTYTCTATNKLGTTKRTVEVFVYTLHITPPPETRSVKVNKLITLHCDADGIPKPDLKWIFYSSDPAIAPEILSTTEADHTIEKIKVDQRGAYVCVASNIGGSMNITHIVEVSSKPEVQTDIKKEYNAVEGDYSLKLHCRATGNPRPEITWWRSGVRLAAGSKFYMEEDWLIVKHVEISDGLEYICEAKNKNGQDSGTFKVIVEKCPPPDSITSMTTKLIKEGVREPIQCSVSHKEVDLVVWYKDGTLFHKGELELPKPKPRDSGVYTCRVSHKDLPIMESANTIVVVGSKPTFDREEKENVELEFGQSGFLMCKFFAEPEPTVIWWHNKEIMKFSEMVYNFEMDTETIGQYKCTVTNDFGSISRTFHLSLSECILKVDKDSKYQPLMLTMSGKWPAFKVIDGLTFVPKGQDFLLKCPKSFKSFGRTDVTGHCVQGTTLKFNGVLYDYTDIKCNEEVESSTIPTRTTCYGKDTKMNKQVLDVNHKTIEVYEVCVDKHGYPIYAKHTMRNPAGNEPKDTSILDDKKLDGLYKCKNQESFFNKFRRPFLKKRDCCFARRHLVNPKDVSPGPSQRATYSRLNMVPHWSSCHAENWNEVEERVRKLSKSINQDLIVYTGMSHHFSLPARNARGTMKTTPLLLGRKKTSQPIHVYLWKVIQFPADGSSVAIIQLNIPDATPSEVGKRVLCRDICRELPWIKGPNWQIIENGYTFCCALKDFETMFGYSGVFEPGLYNNILI